MCKLFNDPREATDVVEYVFQVFFFIIDSIILFFQLQVNIIFVSDIHRYRKLFFV